MRMKGDTMLFDPWKTGKVPTRREEEARRKQLDAEQHATHVVRPGLTIKDGKFKYDPWQDPEWTKYIQHHQHLENMKKAPVLQDGEVEPDWNGWPKGPKQHVVDEDLLAEPVQVGLDFGTDQGTVLAGVQYLQGELTKAMRQALFGDIEPAGVVVTAESATKTPAEILADVNALLKQVWGAPPSEAPLGCMAVYCGATEPNPKQREVHRNSGHELHLSSDSGKQVSGGDAPSWWADGGYYRD